MRAAGAIEVTVVMPTHDRWGLARAALQGALAQKGVSLEVCVVDDASVMTAPPDFAVDGRVRLFRNDRNAGVAASRNRGIREARGEWVAFLDDDDLWAPWHLQHVLRAAQSDGARWAFGRYVLTDLSRAPLRNGPGPIVEADYERQFLQFNPVGTTSAAIVSTATLRNLGGFHEQLSMLADWDLWLRLVRISPPAISTSCSVGYAQHDGNMSLDMDGVRAELAHLARRHRSIVERVGAPLADNHFFWSWVAEGYARRQRRLQAARFYLKSAFRGRERRDLVRAIDMVPLVNGPIRVRRKAIRALRRAVGSGQARPNLQQGWSTDHTWLQLPADLLAVTALEASVPGGGSAHWWRVRTRTSPWRRPT
jgi:hypothetical protein